MRQLTSRTHPTGLTELGQKVVAIGGGIAYLVGIGVMIFAANRISMEIGLLVTGALLAFGGWQIHRDITRDR